MEKKYLPIEGEEELFYGMNINKEDYRWIVADMEDGSLCKFISNAKEHSLKEVIKKFKEEFR